MPPTRIFLWGATVSAHPPQERAKPSQRRTVTNNVVRRPTRWGGSPPRIVTLRGAARGSYLETLPQLFSNSSTLLQILPPSRPKSKPKLVQILPRPSQILPKSSQILRKIDPKSIQKPSWSPFWINALQKLDFERPRNGQEAPKSNQKTPQSAPTPSQMEPKTVPNLFLEHFFGLIFPYEICMDF